MGKTQCLYLEDGTKSILRMTMTEIYKQLSQYQEFIRIGVASWTESLNQEVSKWKKEP